jgi:hypothetical protein
MQIKRKQEWPELLHEYIDSNVSTPFAYGVHDCCLFVADAVQAITDVDLAVDYRGKYTDLKSSLHVIKDVTGGSTVEDVIVHAAQQSELTECPSVLYAQRGDVVLLDHDETLALGIVHLDGVHALFVSESGLHKLPVKQCRRAWRIG